MMGDSRDMYVKMSFKIVMHSGERDVGGVSEMLLKIPIFNDILNVP